MAKTEEGIIGGRISQQTFDWFIKPEISKRWEECRLPPQFTLWAAQVLFSLRGCEVRLNEEVRVVLLLKIEAGKRML